jgi:hypothetical protein
MEVTWVISVVFETFGILWLQLGIQARADLKPQFDYIC